jgi:hypothetical protein
MPSGQDPVFVVDRLPQVSARIRELARKAKVRGFLREYLKSLRIVLEKLERDPVSWGDPEYHATTKGSIVCHGVHGPLYVQYVVFELERVVMILQIKAMPNSELE